MPFRVGRLRIDSLHRHLTEHEIRLSVRQGMLRMAFHLYNTEDDMCRVLEAQRHREARARNGVIRGAFPTPQPQEAMRPPRSAAPGTRGSLRCCRARAGRGRWSSSRSSDPVSALGRRPILAKNFSLSTEERMESQERVDMALETRFQLADLTWSSK